MGVRSVAMRSSATRRRRSPIAVVTSSTSVGLPEEPSLGAAYLLGDSLRLMGTDESAVPFGPHSGRMPPRMRGGAVVARALVTAALGLALGTATPDAAHALNIGGPGVSPADFRITAFATGLNFPYGMQLLSDGSLLVATSRPVDPNNPSFFNSVGELIRLLDTNGDGVADSSSIALSGLPGVLTGLGVAGNLVFV